MLTSCLGKHCSLPLRPTSHCASKLLLLLLLLPAVNGTCSDGKFCTTNDKCNSEGICVGGPLETCDPQPANQCMRRYCNATSQQCVEEAKPDTTPCDRNGCTRDECRGGQCVGVQVKPGTPCSTSATCRTSTCNITTGVCDLSITFPGEHHLGVLVT